MPTIPEGEKRPAEAIGLAVLISKHAWFGPKRFFGWGWSPVSWEGWAAIGVLFWPYLASAFSSDRRAPGKWLLQLALQPFYSPFS